MTRYEIARLLGWPNPPKESDLLDRVESIVKRAAMAEREACAKAAEGYADFQLQLGDDLAQWRAIGALAVMAVICARGQE